MKWRDYLRRPVNRADDLSPWRLRLLRLVDPVEWYMRKDEHRSPPARQRAPHEARGWVAYAPLRQDRLAGARPDEPPIPPKTVAESREDTHADWEALRLELRQRFGEYFVARARDVVAGRAVTIRTNVGTVRARLIRFWNGAVFETDSFAPSRTGHGRTRVDNRTLRDPVPVLANYLIDDVASLGPGAEPRP